MKLYAVKYAESFFGENHILNGGRSDVLLPIDFTLFLFEEADRRILVDAGCDTMPGWDMRYFESPSVILERAGIPCDSITDVIITHHHHDHIDGVRHFPKAVFHIQESEYPLGKNYFNKDAKISTFIDGCELCGGIKVIKIGGHSVGSCIVEFPFGKKTGVISGDEIYYKCRLDEAKGKDADKCSPFVRKYSDEKYEVFVMHQPTFLPGRNGVELIFDNEK